MLTPFESIGVLVGIAQKNGIATRARKSGEFAVRLTIRCDPLTLTPETVFALPSSLASTPAMSLMNGVAGDCIFGSASRSIAALKFWAVTGCPFENFVKPTLTLKS